MDESLSFNVIIATHNRPELLKKAIQSVLDNTYQNFTIEVTNDNGVDVSNIVESFHDNRIHYYQHETNLGLGSSRNTGIKNSYNSIITCLDDDDLYTPWHLEFLARYFQETDYKIIYTDCIRDIWQKNQFGQYQSVHRDIPYSINYDQDVILFQNITPVTSVGVYRSVLEEIGLFDETLLRYEDHDRWLAISRKYPMLHVPIPTAIFTWRNDQDGNSMSSTMDNLFTTQLPIIYKRYWKTAKNKPYVCSIMNQILAARGLPEMFKITSKGEIVEINYE